MTISLSAKTPAPRNESTEAVAWVPTNLTVFDQATDEVEGFAISTPSGHYRLDVEQAQRLALYLLDAPTDAAIVTAEDGTISIGHLPLQQAIYSETGQPADVRVHLDAPAADA